MKSVVLLRDFLSQVSNRPGPLFRRVCRCLSLLRLHLVAWHATYVSFVSLSGCIGVFEPEL
jgi:hypothetical protein